jgi:hypothetical protein
VSSRNITMAASPTGAAIDKHTSRWLGQIGLNELPR